MSEDIYAIVSLMGHNKIAGRVSEYNLGGTFVRVDVPAVNGNQPFTKLYGTHAIFEIAFVDKDVCMAAAGQLDIRPIDAYTARAVMAEAVKNRMIGHEPDSIDPDEIPF